jgi:hypothetical protein
MPTLQWDREGEEMIAYLVHHSNGSFSIQTTYVDEMDLLFVYSDGKRMQRGTRKRTFCSSRQEAVDVLRLRLEPYITSLREQVDDLENLLVAEEGRVYAQKRSDQDA